MIGAKIKRFISDYCTCVVWTCCFIFNYQALQEFNKSKNNKLSVIVKKNSDFIRPILCN
jgi:hypothetical protein